MISAHGVSLPLFNAMQRVQFAKMDDAVSSISTALTNLSLASEIAVEVGSNSEGVARLNLKAKTEFGQKVIIKEVETRCSFPPCPDEECRFTTDNTCIWCGGTLRA